MSEDGLYKYQGVREPKVKPLDLSMIFTKEIIFCSLFCHPFTLLFVVDSKPKPQPLCYLSPSLTPLGMSGPGKTSPVDDRSRSDSPTLRSLRSKGQRILFVL